MTRPIVFYACICGTVISTMVGCGVGGGVSGCGCGGVRRG